jgi:hypothetical protein
VCDGLRFQTEQMQKDGGPREGAVESLEYVQYTVFSFDVSPAHAADSDEWKVENEWHAFDAAKVVVGVAALDHRTKRSVMARRSVPRRQRRFSRTVPEMRSSMASLSLAISGSTHPSGLAHQSYGAEAARSR